MNDIPIGVDDTDHIAFFCPECRDINGINSPMFVTKVYTNRMVVNTRTGAKDKCTWIHLKCPTCNDAGQRKFYWKGEDEENCRHRTDEWTSI